MNNPPKKPEPPKVPGKDDKMSIEKPKIEKKKNPFKLIVEDAVNDENSSIVLNPKRLLELKLGRGEQVILKGKKRRDSIAAVLSDPKDGPVTD
jgi:hypothetical protein